MSPTVSAGYSQPISSCCGMLRRCRPLLGTFVEIAADSEMAIEAAFAAVQRVHDLMSAHGEDSDLSRINRSAHLTTVTVAPWTAAVLRRAIFWSQESGGAFDVVRAGRSALASCYLPRHPEQPTPNATDFSALALDGDQVSLNQPATIDLGGIAKGFAVDRAIDTLKDRGCDYGFVDAGGDLAGFGRPWPILVRDPSSRVPRAEIMLRDGALATSGLVDGSLGHVSGAAPERLSATVRAPTAIDADALTKIVLVGSGRTTHCLRLVNARAFYLERRGPDNAILKEAA